MRTFGLVGFPLSHSFSKAYFTQKFKEKNIQAQYLNFEIENIRDIIPIIKNTPDLCGFNITIPHKQSIMPLLDNIDVAASDIGAVNVVKIERDNGIIELSGYNSDYIGFRKSFQSGLKSFHKAALVLGTGGASRAIVYTLKQLGIDYMYVSRKPGIRTLMYNQLDERTIREYPIIINCSPVGTYPNVNDAPDIPYEAITDEHYLYDLVYNPEETAFLARGAQMGATTRNGLEMLHLQAEAAWTIWNT